MTQTPDPDVEFLDRCNHFYYKTDGTYKFPSSREGDLLRMAMKALQSQSKPQVNNAKDTCYYCNKIRTARWTLIMEPTDKPDLFLKKHVCPDCSGKLGVVRVDGDVEGPCWLSKKGIQNNGYSKCSKGFVHRLVYEMLVGKIPKGKLVLHKCDVRNCINPDHLYVGDHKDNAIDCVERKRHPMTKRTHCKNGHEFTKENTRPKLHIPNGRKHRLCLVCVDINNKKRPYGGRPPKA